MTDVLSKEERNRLLRTLEEDRELRYALMGLLGFKEVLDRITRIEERFTKLEERFAELEKRFLELAERQQKLEERMIALEERLAKLEERMEVLNRTVIVIAHRFGVVSEEGFRGAMKYVLEDVFGVAKVERWIYSDVKGSVYGYPSVIEVDVVIKDGVHILIELKSRVSKGDIAELSRIGKLYEEVTGIKPKLAIIGGFVDPNAYEAARRLGVELKPIT